MPIRVCLCALALLLLLAGASGCAVTYRAPVIPPFAATFTQTSAPMNLNFRATELGDKRGEATSTSILGWISYGDSSIAAAARQGNIKTINHADSRLTSVLGVYATHTTIVYGD